MALLSEHEAQASNLYNREAVIPPQCYTRTEGHYNPCYVCHQTHPEGSRNNVMNDGVIQGLYIFSEPGETNRWSNLFTDRSEAIGRVSDEAILDYVRTDNYDELIGETNRIESESASPAGYLPDLQGLGQGAAAFDKRGLALDGSGWVAFNYKPLPSTFWPTNGNYDDVLIRLPVEFHQNEAGKPDEAIYWLNLSLLEMAIKDLPEMSIPATEETRVGVDLNGDGQLGEAQRMVQRRRYLGAASEVETLRFSYPTGTEFLHSVRYLDVDANGQIQPSARLKELRYSRKYKTLSKQSIEFMYNQEDREKAEERLPRYSWAKPAAKAGMNNKMGWLIQGWIEDADGQLRLQNYEENFFCMGCHTTTGTTIDHTFAFPRKVTGRSGWGYLDLKGMKDVPSWGEGPVERSGERSGKTFGEVGSGKGLAALNGEIATYLLRVGGGDEFRQNQEMIRRWFHEDGRLNEEAVASADVYQLITPSKERALQLNKAYQQIVLEQSYSRGRDALLGDAPNVYHKVDPASAPLLPADRRFHYDLRLQWPDQPSSNQTPSGEVGQVSQTQSHIPAPAKQRALVPDSTAAAKQQPFSRVLAGMLAMAVFGLFMLVVLFLKTPGRRRRVG